jgi:hypothetical protein
MSHSSLNDRDNIPKTTWSLGRCANTDIIICEETSSECLSYASTAPNIVQISAFLITKDRLLKCVGLKSADFQVPPSDIE